MLRFGSSAFVGGRCQAAADRRIGRVLRAIVPFINDTVPVGDLVSPDPALVGVQVALRLFRVGDAAAISNPSRIPTFPSSQRCRIRSEEHATQWVERGLDWWLRGLRSLALGDRAFNVCAGQIGIQFDFAMGRAAANRWHTLRIRNSGGV